jgi:heme/copper-type cytochrome/quinol oxidase subunit 1
VNAVGMLIATPVFALLLIFMVLEINLDIQFVDALIAKNMLWWFGHPVVYQLLFPMAGVYYLLVPQYAKRPLIGQRLIAGTWFVAFLVQNIVWAHHIFMDFVQPLEITVAMQLTTYVITIPSLASIFSLFATIYVGKWEWNTTTRFAFTGIVGWFLAGIQGVINATVWENTIIHNTLWVPGHLHTMALFNISMAIFAATYYLLPRITGRPIAESHARIHWWGTIIGIVGMVHFWLLQGLLGVPRRLSDLPDAANLLTVLSVPFFILVVAAQYYFFAVIWKNIWGSKMDTLQTTAAA